MHIDLDECLALDALDYIETVTMIRERNRQFFQSHWMIVSMTIKELYQKFVSNFPADVVSLPF